MLFCNTVWVASALGTHHFLLPVPDPLGVGVGVELGAGVGCTACTNVQCNVLKLGKIQIIRWPFIN